MMKKSQKSKTQTWNESFQEFQPSNLKKKAKKEAKEKKEGDDQPEEKKEGDSEDKKEDKKEEKTETEEVNQEEKGVDETRIYVMNLPFSITESDIHDQFQKFGDIEEIDVPLQKGAKSKGYCFVKYRS